MKNKLCIIITYFGEFPQTIDAFFESCKYNENFKWMIFTDCSYEKLPSNVEIIKTTLQDIKKLIENKVGMNIVLEKPYKLCDYRPAYGVIFEDYIKEYDFWGYGDIDLVYGDLSAFITDEICYRYDKIYPCGHLAFIRNTPEINNIYTKKFKGTLNYDDVFSSSTSFIFDEYKGINEKLILSGKTIYGNIDFVDIDIIYNRFRRVDKRTISMVFPKYPFKKNLPKNYKNQLFFWSKGKAYVLYLDSNNNIKYEEVLYIHYRKNIKCDINIFENDSYFITNNGFIKFDNTNLVEKISELNKFPGKLAEDKEFLKMWIENKKAVLGKNKKLRNFIRILKGKKRI